MQQGDRLPHGDYFIRSGSGRGTTSVAAVCKEGVATRLSSRRRLPGSEGAHGAWGACRLREQAEGCPMAVAPSSKSREHRLQQFQGARANSALPAER